MCGELFRTTRLDSIKFNVPIVVKITINSHSNILNCYVLSQFIIRGWCSQNITCSFEMVARIYGCYVGVAR